MNKIVVLVGITFTLLGALMLSMVPDVLSMAILVVMLVAILLGFLFGMVPTAMYATGFRKGIKSVQEASTVQASSRWYSAQQMQPFFHQRALDALYTDYVEKTKQQTNSDIIISDIEEVINEESLALRSWQGVVLQIPGTLTALGLLGTFIGLVIGISNIGFSSVQAALDSIELLLSGIETAFFTSIVGVIFSILFNVFYKLLWNAMLREMGMFMEQFHRDILPSSEEQKRVQQSANMKLILERLDRIPKEEGFSLGSTTATLPAQGVISDNQDMAQKIHDAFMNNEFVFYLQPRHLLRSQKIIGGEALIRWISPQMGLVPPKDFLPIAEASGKIVQLDTYIWESVFRTLHKWIYEYRWRDVPRISVNVSKTDLTAIDVFEFFNRMAKTYRVPTNYVEIEFAANAYVQAVEASDAEENLRAAGFSVVVDGFNGNFTLLNAIVKGKAHGAKFDMRNMRPDPKTEKYTPVILPIFKKCQDLNIPLSVEGIESEAQLSELKNIGFTEGQGYVFEAPMSVKDFENYFTNPQMVQTVKK